MPKLVAIEGVGQVEFPDDASPAEILDFANTIPARPPVRLPAANLLEGNLNAFQRGVLRMKQGFHDFRMRALAQPEPPGIPGNPPGFYPPTADPALSDVQRFVADVVNRETPKSSRAYSEAQEAIEKLPKTAIAEEYDKATTPALDLLKHPVEILSQGYSESLPWMFPVVLASAAGPLGTAAASGISSHTAESSARVQSAMVEDGVDLKKPEQVLAWFRNRAKSAPAIAKADLAALGPATFDALTGFTAGKILKPAIGKGVGRVAAATAAEMGQQMAGGGLGSIAGNLIAGEPIDWKDALLEIALEASLIEAGSNVLTERRAQRVKAEMANPPFIPKEDKPPLLIPKVEPEPAVVETVPPAKEPLPPLLEVPKAKGLPGERAQIIRLLGMMETTDPEGNPVPKRGQETRVTRLRTRLGEIEREMAGLTEKGQSDADQIKGPVAPDGVVESGRVQETGGGTEGALPAPAGTPAPEVIATPAAPTQAKPETPPVVPAEPTPPPAAPERVLVRNAGPQPHVILERLPATATEVQNGEQPVRIRNERTNEESVVLESNLTPIGQKQAKPEAAPKRDLDAELRAAGMDPSAFPNRKAKLSALRRAKALGQVPKQPSSQKLAAEPEPIAQAAPVEAPAEPSKTLTAGNVETTANVAVAQQAAPIASPAEPVPSESKSKKVVAKLESLKRKRSGKVGAAFGALSEAGVAVWNTGLDIAIQAVRAGAALATAIESGWQHIKAGLEQLGEKLDEAALRAEFEAEAARQSTPEGTVSFLNDAISEPELAEAIVGKAAEAAKEGAITTQIFGKLNRILGRQQLTPELMQQSADRAKELLLEAGFTEGDLSQIGYTWALKPDAPANAHEAAARKLSEILQRELGKGREDAPRLRMLEDSIRAHFTGDKITSISQATKDELLSYAQGEVSLIGLLLAMSARVAKSIEYVGRDIETNLRQVYDQRFGGETIRAVLKEAMAVFRAHFSDSDLESISRNSPELVGLVNRLITLKGNETANRIARRVDSRMREKPPTTDEQKKAKALEDEAVEAIIDQMKREGAVEPDAAISGKLTPDERLALMAKQTTVDKLQLAIEAALAAKETEAGIRATLDAESDPEQLDILRQQAASGELVPSQEMVEIGMRRPEYAHWAKVRGDLLNYSPVSVKLIQDVLKAKIRGLQFSAPSETVSVDDPRINIRQLAVSPEAEVQRVMAAQMALIGETLDATDASIETRTRILEITKQLLADQISAVRRAVLDRVFAEKLAAKPLTADDMAALRALANAGLFRDPRLNVAGMVDRLAASSALNRLLPSPSELVKQVFATPFWKQSELAENFANALVDRLGLPQADRAEAIRVFNAAFDSQFQQARAKAQAAATAALAKVGITKRVVGRKKSLLAKIENAVNAGNFDSSDLISKLAVEGGFPRLTPERAAEIRGWTRKIQELRTLPDSERANAGGDPVKLEQAQKRWEANNLQRIQELQAKIHTAWSMLTRPLGLGKHWRNTAEAGAEWVSAALLFKPFFPIRQSIDVAFQNIFHIQTRILQHAWDMAVENRQRGLPAAFHSEFATALLSGLKQQKAAFRPAIAATTAALTEHPRNRNIDALVNEQIRLFDRLQMQMEQAISAKQHGKAVLLYLMAQVRWGRQWAAALDNLNQLPAEALELRQQVIAALRRNGFNRAQAEMAADPIIGDMQADWHSAMAFARQADELQGATRSESQLKQSAWDIVVADIYSRIKLAQLPADAIHEKLELLKNRVGWNDIEEGGPGSIVSATIRAANRLGNAFPPALIISLPLGRFSNAIHMGVNTVASLTPLGFFPGAFGVTSENIDPVTGIAKGGSVLFRTAEDRRQMKMAATIGSTFGPLMGFLIFSGIASYRGKPPDDPEERELWLKTHKSGTVEFNNADGTFYSLSLNTGPMRFLGPWIAGFGTLREKMEDTAKRQAKLDADAAATGLPAGQARGLGWGDMLAVAGNSAWATMMGGRTASGLLGSMTDYGVPNPNKMAASVVSPFVPLAPAWQEIQRVRGVQLDSKLAGFWDYLWPLQSSGAARVNLLGDKVGTESLTQRIIQTATGGSYPFPQNEADIKGHSAYKVLFATDYRPPTISPIKAHSINGELRPFTTDELSAYTVKRGTYLKEELAKLDSEIETMAPQEAKKAAQAAYRVANQRALSELGVSVPAKPERPRSYRPIAYPSSSGTSSGYRRPSYRSRLLRGSTARRRRSSVGGLSVARRRRSLRSRLRRRGASTSLRRATALTSGAF